MDPRFRVEVVAATPSPQQICYAAMHQDYAEEFVWEERDRFPNETEAGKIIVKRLLKSNRGHYGCYSSDTEVLTARGWVDWPSVTKNDKLFAVDLQTLKGHFETPKEIQKVEFQEGDQMYSVSSQYLNLLVTKDHRMIVSTRKKTGDWTGWTPKTAESIYQKPVRYCLAGHLAEEKRNFSGLEHKNLLSAFKLAGFFVGDGLRTKNKKPKCVRFRLRKNRKIEYIGQLGFNVKPGVGERFTVECPELASWIHSEFSSAQGKSIPDWILFCPKPLIDAFFDGLKKSDGTRITEKSWSYDSSQREIIDKIQAIAVINGLSGNITLNHPNEGNQNHNPGWRICLSNKITKRVEACQKGRSPGITENLVPYSGTVYCATVSTGAMIVRRNGKAIICGNCLEHPQIILNFGYFPHSTMQQVRTHRNVSFDVQSFRYTGRRILDAVEGKREVEDVFYLRPVGIYRDREGGKYHYSLDQREQDLEWCFQGCVRYAERVSEGVSEEHARGLIPFDVRQHWVMSGNARAIMHLLDIRGKFDVQLETRQMTELMFTHFQSWMPEVAAWYEKNRWRKGTLAP